MKPQTIYFKVAALGFSLLLLTAFVAWQSGAFAGFLDNEVPPQPAAVEDPPSSENGTKTFFVGSKSAPLGSVPIATPPASAAAKPRMIGGSKSLVITPAPPREPITTAPEQPGSPPAPRPDTAKPPSGT